MPKMFLVHMITSFGGLTYNAYFETNVEDNNGEIARCMTPLSKLIATILIEQIPFTFLSGNSIPRCQG